MKTFTSKNLLEGYYYVNPNITEENYPIPKFLNTRNPIILKFEESFTSKEAIERINKEGLRPATLWELAAWKQDNHKMIEKGKSYLAFGDMRFVDGRHRVPYVYAYSDGDLRFDLGYFGPDGNDYRRLLCFCDDTLKLSNFKTSDLKSFDPDTTEARLIKIENWIKKEANFINPFD